MKKHLVPVSLILLLLLAVFLLIASCLISASDAQGAFVFIFSLPLILALLIFSYLLLPYAPYGKRQLQLALWVLSGFMLLFFAGAFIPPLQFIPQAVVNGLSLVFEYVSGHTPYSYMRQ